MLTVHIQGIKMMSCSHSITASYTTNAERLGESRNTATVLLSPLFYDDKHRDLKMLFEAKMSHIVAQVEARAAQNPNAVHTEVAMKRFIHQMRQNIIVSNHSQLQQLYDAALIELFEVDTIEEAIAIISDDSSNYSFIITKYLQWFAFDLQIFVHNQYTSAISLLLTPIMNKSLQEFAGVCRCLQEFARACWIMNIN